MIESESDTDAGVHIYKFENKYKYAVRHKPNAQIKQNWDVAWESPGAREVTNSVWGLDRLNKGIGKQVGQVQAINRHSDCEGREKHRHEREQRPGSKLRQHTHTLKCH